MDYDDAYANAAHIDGAESYPGRWLTASRDWVAQQAPLGLHRKALSYGPGERQIFDLFLPRGAPRGLLVFVHGGFWLKFDRTYWFHLSRGAIDRGWAAAIPSYDLCPAIRISGITRQIVAAITAAASLVAGPIVLTGHSAGGHLVARMLEPGLLAPDVATRLRHVLPISPLSDLRPLMHTKMNAALKIDAQEAMKESPIFMQRRLDVLTTVWVGAEERPAFLDQARWLSGTWSAAQVIAPSRHHFDVIEPLSDAHSTMVTTLLE